MLEEYEHAVARGANIVAELVGFGATSDGFDMVAPSGEGAIRCMQQALESVDGSVDYVNTHGTSTPVGDLKELQALKEVFKDQVMPFISATKSLSGHALGAAGVHEAIYTLIMMKEKFLSASANILELDPEAKGMPILLENMSKQIKTAMSNSFGFGGTNATLVFQDV